MRRAILAAVLVLSGLSTAARADSWFGPQFPYHVYYSGCHSCPYGYKQHGYGLNARGLVYGRNGFGPRYTPANGTAPNPGGFYVGSPLGPNTMFYAGSVPRPAPGSSFRSRIPAEVLNPPDSTLPGEAPYPTTQPMTLNAPK